MKRKLGVISDCMKGESELNALCRIKDYGFDCFFSSEKEFGIRFYGERKMF